MSESERERLVELLLESEPIKERDLDDGWGDNEISDIADYLLENGVIVPPVKVGGIVWIIYNKCVIPANVLAVYVDKSGGKFELKILAEGLKSIVNKDYTFDMVYLTKEEAEQAIQALKGDAE